ncbi:hypothetical protein UlMin_031163 [Ulmus minor]
MVVRTLNVEKDQFRPCKDNEEIVGPEVSYLSAIGALMYLANCTRPDITFVVNLLARFSSSPTRRHWNGIKHIFCYLQGTIDLGLFYPNESKKWLVGYAVRVIYQIRIRLDLILDMCSHVEALLFLGVHKSKLLLPLLQIMLKLLHSMKEVKNVCG